MAKKAESNKQVKITLVKSTIACKKKQILTVKALGLKKIGESKVFNDNACLRGMINVVAHLVSVEEI